MYAQKGFYALKSTLAKRSMVMYAAKSITRTTVASKDVSRPQMVKCHFAKLVIQTMPLVVEYVKMTILSFNPILIFQIMETFAEKRITTTTDAQEDAVRPKMEKPRFVQLWKMLPNHVVRFEDEKNFLFKIKEMHQIICCIRIKPKI